MLEKLLLLSRAITRKSAKNKLISLAAIIGADSVKTEDIAFLPLADAILLYNQKNINHENKLEEYFSLSSMNESYYELIPLDASEGNKHISIHNIYIHKYPSGFLIKDNSGRYLGASKDLMESENTIYYAEESDLRKIKPFFDNSKFVRIKYIKDYVNEIINISDQNKKKYKNVLQNLILSGNKIQIRTSEEPREDYGDTIVAMNEDGFIVGMASDEWGATLIAVAKEYRGLGIGTALSKIWKRINPSYRSGGFSYGGLNTFKKVWAKRVQEHLSNGTFSDAISKGILGRQVIEKIIEDYKKININKGDILKDLGSGVVTNSFDENKQLFIYPNNYGFVLFDNKFFEKYDDKYIYAEGRLEFDDYVGYYVYSLDYSAGNEEIASRIIMQIAKNRGIKYLYNDEGYSDFISLSGINEARIVSKKIDGGSQNKEYIEINSDTLPSIRSMIFDKSILGSVQKHEYDEMIYMLIESAESKSW